MAKSYPPCDKRKIVNGIAMCYAIGCCEIGDMPCECCGCTKKCKKRGQGKDNKEQKR